MAFYKKRVVYRDDPETIAWRFRYSAAVKQALADATAKFPEITAENIKAADAYRQRRIDELMNSF
jgi:uncharacterized protein (DUF433 family)